MAGIQEIALGVARVLRLSPEPEPLPLTFVGQTLEEAAELVSRVVIECADAGLILHRIDLDPALWGYIPTPPSFETTARLWRGRGQRGRLPQQGLAKKIW
jgi:hypothetical protein